MNQSLFDHTTEDDRRPKWLNSPISFHDGSLSEIQKYIPDFERRAFGLTQPEGEWSRLNEHLDTIIRKPFGNDPNFIPIGVVSKNYALVPHKDVLDAAIQALQEAEICSDEVRVELTITEYGERMGLSLYLPKQYSFDPGDGNPMTMRLECLNSVDGSTRFRALVGWFRFVCRNGLIVGITKTDFLRRHIGDLSITDIGNVLQQGLKDADEEIKNFKSWRERSIKLDEIASWIEEDVRKTWGFKAATRTFHIAKSGYDVDIAGNYKDKKPATIQVRKTRRVPGTPDCVQNAFDISQILAWLAKERNDFQEQFEWRHQIPALMKGLLNRGRHV